MKITLDRPFYRLKNACRLLSIHRDYLIDLISDGLLIPAIPVHFPPLTRFSKMGDFKNPMEFSAKEMSLEFIEGFGCVAYFNGNILQSYESLVKSEGKIPTTSLTDIHPSIDMKDYWLVRYQGDYANEQYLTESPDLLEIIITKKSLEKYLGNTASNETEQPKLQTNRVKPATKEKYKKWQQAVEKMKKSKPYLTHRAICMRLADEFKVPYSTIRRNTRLLSK